LSFRDSNSFQLHRRRDSPNRSMCPEHRRHSSGKILATTACTRFRQPHGLTHARLHQCQQPRRK
jgi:hypothetical protein